jgi:hypothetical protein
MLFPQPANDVPELISRRISNGRGGKVKNMSRKVKRNIYKNWH